MKETIDLIYPVGRTIICDHNPQDDYTWQKWEQDFKDAFPLGAGDAYAAGSTGGEAVHTLTANEMPSHSHFINGHTIYWVSSGEIQASGDYGRFGRVNPDSQSYTGSAGGSQAHNNMPPYKAVKFWTRKA